MLSEDGFNFIFNIMQEERQEWMVVSKLGDLHERLPIFNTEFVEFVRDLILNADGPNVCTEFEVDYMWTVGCFYSLLHLVSSESCGLLLMSIYVDYAGIYRASIFLRSLVSKVTICMSMRDNSMKRYPAAALSSATGGGIMDAYVNFEAGLGYDNDDISIHKDNHTFRSLLQHCGCPSYFESSNDHYVTIFDGAMVLDHLKECTRQGMPMPKLRDWVEFRDDRYSCMRLSIPQALSRLYPFLSNNISYK